MKIKLRHGIVLISGIIVLALGFKYLLTPNLTEKRAFMILFGNYDDIHKRSIWKNIPFPEKETDGYFSKKIGIVSSVFFKTYKENGQKKFVLLTKTVPIDIPFECHACLPLLSATIFSRKNRGWQIEAQNLFLMYAGEYGVAPTVKLIPIGLHKFGLILESQYINGEFESKEISLVVPYKTQIINAHQETIYYDNFNGCGWSAQCATYHAKIDFDKSRKGEFYLLNIKRFGTQDDPDQNYKAVPIDEESIYQLKNGQYTPISWKGYPKIKYD